MEHGGCYIFSFYMLINFEHSILNKHTETELKFATSQGAWIVPVLIGNLDMSKWMASWLGQCYGCTENSTEEDFVDILNKIRNMNAQIDTE